MPSAHKDPYLWAILAAAALLLFWDLDGRTLWQDEAETALLGRNILRFGLPIACDGTNVVSQEAGREFGPDFLWRWSPWLQFYTAAASLAVFGPTTLAARLPFALLGLLTVPLTYLLARRLFGSPLVARLSALFLTLSVPFLLHARQARWYAPAYLFLVLLLLSLSGLVRGQRFATAGLVAAGVFLFYTNYFVALGALLALLASAPLLGRDRTFLLRLLKASSLILILILPGMSFFQVLDKKGTLRAAQVLAQFRACQGSYFTFLLPLPVLAVLCLLLTRKALGSWLGTGWRRGALFLLAFSELYLAYLSLAPWLFFRYLSFLLPPAAILLALTTAWLVQQSPLLGTAAAALLLFTDALHLYPLGLLEAAGTVAADTPPSFGPVGSPLLGYAYELTHKMDVPEQALAAYLNRHADPGDVVLITYGDLPLQFYTGLKVVGGLQGRQLPPNPDWIILRHFIMSNQAGKDGDVHRFVQAQIDLDLYEPVDLGGADLRLETNPDPDFHLFRAPEHPPPLRLLHRKNTLGKKESRRLTPLADLAKMPRS